MNWRERFRRYPVSGDRSDKRDTSVTSVSPLIDPRSAVPGLASPDPELSIAEPAPQFHEPERPPAPDIKATFNHRDSNEAVSTIANLLAVAYQRHRSLLRVPSGGLALSGEPSVHGVVK